MLRFDSGDSFFNGSICYELKAKCFLNWILSYQYLGVCAVFSDQWLSWQVGDQTSCQSTNLKSKSHLL